VGFTVSLNKWGGRLFWDVMGHGRGYNGRVVRAGGEVGVWAGRWIGEEVRRGEGWEGGCGVLILDTHDEHSRLFGS